MILRKARRAGRCQSRAKGDYNNHNNNNNDNNNDNNNNDNNNDNDNNDNTQYTYIIFIMMTMILMILVTIVIHNNDEDTNTTTNNNNEARLAGRCQSRAKGLDMSMREREHMRCQNICVVSLCAKGLCLCWALSASRKRSGLFISQTFV